MTEKTGLLVVGGGPGGYHAAIRAAQLGLDVTCVDEGTFGGVCLHRGCIPSKGLIGVGKLVAEAKAWEERGLSFGEVKVDLKKVQAWKQGQIDTLAKGVEQLMTSRGVEVVKGRAKLTGKNTAEIDGRKITFEQALLAPGSKSIELPHLPFDHERVLSSRSALTFENVPKSLAVIGGGFIGLEIGQLYSQLGAEVTVIEMMDQILPGADPALGKQLARELKKQGITIKTGTKAADAKVTKKGVKLTLEGKGDETETLDAERVLVAVGRKPRTTDLGLEEAGVEVDEKGFIAVDEQMRTSNPKIFAIGDAVPGPALAHKASHEGVHAAAVAAGDKDVVVDYRAVPWFCYTTPEVAGVGMTEAEAREALGDDLTVAQFPFSALGKARMAGHTEGWCKIIADSRGAVIGVHIVGHHATNLIAEPALAIEMGATLTDVVETIHAHPTLNEVFLEAAEVALGHPIHVAK